jgi:hypothetical protein
MKQLVTKKSWDTRTYISPAPMAYLRSGIKRNNQIGRNKILNRPDNCLINSKLN